MLSVTDSGVYILIAKRTPIGKINGQYQSIPAHDLFARLVGRSIDSGLYSDIDEIIVGNAVGGGGNLARLAALTAGIPESVPATTIDYQCGASLKALQYGFSLIKSGQCQVVLAGGAESSSTRPLRYYSPKDPRQKQYPDEIERAQFSPEALGDPGMLEAANNVANQLNISRSAMDEFSGLSHQKANTVVTKGLLKSVITPITEDPSECDQSIRQTNIEALLKRAKPVLPDSDITAANACGMHDGASLVLLASGRWVKKHKISPLAEVITASSIGCDPNLAPLGPVYSTQKIMEHPDLQGNKIDLFEINEAFAVKALAFMELNGCPPDTFNILGGSLAYGHPYAATGTILIAHLIRALELRNGRYGIAGMGVAGGQGISVLIRNCQHVN